jgi:hypothetical protein
MIMETMLLKEQDVFPSKEILADALGTSFNAFEDLMSVISGNDYLLIPEWIYYNDGKAWLCKICFKKKTVLWLSAWQGFFKTAFYFTGKNSAGIMELDIDEKIKNDFKCHQPVGRLLPLVINVTKTDQIIDLLKIIKYKKSLK